MKYLLKKLNKYDQKILIRILRLFKRVDKDAVRFKKLTSIHCPDNCSICCRDTFLETTAVEMLPIALNLWAKDEADIWLDKIAFDSTDICVFFKPDKNDFSSGRCSVYDLRPLICRLFGFFTVKDKHGKYVYGSCKVIKEKYPSNYKKAKELIASGFHPSNMTDFTIQIIASGTDLGKKMLPINTATKVALEKIGYILENQKKKIGMII